MCVFRHVRAWFATKPESPPQGRGESELHSVEKLEEIATRLQTVARAQSKLSLRVDELAGEVASNHEQLLGELVLRARDLDDILDALDRLDDAARALGPDQAGLAQGLSAIADRLDRHLRRTGMIRHAELGVEPDGRRFRVVGSEACGDLPDGVITRVVRSAATRGDELVREGEVVINRAGG